MFYYVKCKFNFRSKYRSIDVYIYFRKVRQMLNFVFPSLFKIKMKSRMRAELLELKRRALWLYLLIN